MKNWKRKRFPFELSRWDFIHFCLTTEFEGIKLYSLFSHAAYVLLLADYHFFINHGEQANEKRIQSVSDLLASLLVKYPDLQHLSQRAFVTYLKSIHKQRDKEIFDVTKLPIDEFSASLGLPMTPKIRFLKQKLKGKTVSEALSLLPDDTSNDNLLELPIKKPDTGKSEGEEVEEDLLLAKETQEVGELKINSKGDDMYVKHFLYCLFNAWNFLLSKKALAKLNGFVANLTCVEWWNCHFGKSFIKQ